MKQNGVVGYLFKNYQPIKVERPDLKGEVEDIQGIFEQTVQTGEEFTGYMFVIKGGKE